MAVLWIVWSLLPINSALFLPKDQCHGRCFMSPDFIRHCQCDTDCESYNNCCPDFWNLCRGPETGLVVTQHELDTFAQALWDNDTNRIPFSWYTIDYQGHIIWNSTTDMAAGPLITPTDTQLDNRLTDNSTTYPWFIKLLNNYVLNAQHSEHRTTAEVLEENRFWQRAIKTKDMQIAFDFLNRQGFIKGDLDAFRTVINELWFVPYPTKDVHEPRNSGFEHIMIGERQGGNTKHTHPHIAGFSNWIQYYLQEQGGHIDYLGVISKLQDPPLVHVNFLWKNLPAKGKYFFIGTSPEFDMALYTVCAVVRPKSDCKVTINGQHLTIKTSQAHHAAVTQLTNAETHFSTQAPPTSAPTNP